MNTTTETARARRMLETREKGYGFRLVVRRNFKEYVILIGFPLAIAAYFYQSEAWAAFYLVTGLLFGILSREFAWITGQSMGWPFAAKVIDWEKVQQLADGETPNNDPGVFISYDIKTKKVERVQQ